MQKPKSGNKLVFCRNKRKQKASPYSTVNKKEKYG